MIFQCDTRYRFSICGYPQDNSSEAAKQLFDKIVEFVLENIAVTDNIMINLLSYAEHNELDEDMRALLESGSEQKQVEWLDTLNQQKINKTLLEDQRQRILIL